MMIPVIFVKNPKRYRSLATLFNQLLMISLLPLTASGSICAGPVLADLLDGKIYATGIWSYAGLLAGFVIGGLMHEIGHASACIGYGGTVSEIGLVLGGMPGAYTGIDYMPLNRRQMIQTFAAGIEVNIELTCTALILIFLYPASAVFLTGFAVVNFEYAAVNLLFIDGLDGMAILETVMGDEFLLDNASEVIFDRRRERVLARRGINGRMRVAAAYIIGATRLFRIILITVNILLVLGVFL